MISQQQTQKQQLKILPQQIQLLNLYFLNSIELEQRIKNEMEENPLLEAKEEKEYEEADKDTQDPLKDCQDWEEYNNGDAPDYKAEYQNYFSTTDAPNIPIKNFVHFKDDAKQQLHLLNLGEEDLELAEYVIEAFPRYKPQHRLSLARIREDTAWFYEALQKVSYLEPFPTAAGKGRRSRYRCLVCR